MPAVPAEPRHRRGGAGGAAADGTEPAWYGQKVEVPKRVWGSGSYSPGAVAWHAQITALQRRPERCRASVARLAEWMGDSKRSGERYLRELSAPRPDGTAPELTTIRHTDAAGDGETAERYVRGRTRDEHFARVPVLAAKVLRHPLFVLYCALTYADATATPLTRAELAALLGVTQITVRTMARELERLGWITQHHRTGAHGRNEYTVHDRPLRAVPDLPDHAPSDGGSGASAGGGSLASKEDAGLTDQRNHPPTAVSGIRRRRPTATSARERAELDAFGRRRGLDLTPDAWRTVRGILTPVAHDLAALTPTEWERLVAAVLAQLGDGQTPARLRARLERRYARMRPAGSEPDGRPEIRRTGRWLIGAALTRHGCPDPRCETGTTWPTGEDCPTCALRRERADGLARLTAELDAREAEMAARRPQTPAHRLPDPEPPAPPARPPDTPPHAPTGRVGAPPGTGGWRSLVARERPQAAADAYRHRWHGDHAHHLDTA
ncbi:helix-turn-helix domain-containing protein [Streptomyces antibioticus]|uniref:helix-turn-helix domain-containing protein n=1 Tax=Streptomyces antibioticus TaxID=1890 RepID=UPI0036AA0E3B